MLESDFWRGISILIKNYHAVNRRLFACIITKVLKISKSFNLANITSDDINYHAVLETLETDQYAVCSELELFEYMQSVLNSHEIPKAILFQFKCIAKNNSDNVEALGIIDFNGKSYTCKFDNQKFEDFRLYLDDASTLQTNILLCNNKPNNESSTYWLNNVLKEKLIKWCQNSQIKTSKRKDEINLPTKSLQLIDIEQYAELYKLLKHKHVAKAMQLWQDAHECTDPLKFIHEDLAIAAYLIALWKRTSSEPKAFADLGCGNGLLVYILSEEGYTGYGFDLRSRKLWSLYPATTILIEHAIDPYDLSWLPKDVDWLIGNHSDELSAWMPVLSATAHFDMRFFLLPCCAFELSGAKFQRRNSRLSTFQDFYLYVQKLSIECGFNVLQDRLKIPSTKRLALIGLQRTHNSNLYEQKRKHIGQRVTEERQIYPVDGNVVKIREKHETVRNCTQLDKTMLDALVRRIFLLLLHDKDNSVEPKVPAINSWRMGGRLSLFEIAQQLTRKELLQIKAECGGLKTLLRNRHEIFECCYKDVYKIRYPMSLDNQNDLITKNKTVKKRMCFFQQHHPNKCPLTDEACTFIH